jgi:hypothetical protein
MKEICIIQVFITSLTCTTITPIMLDFLKDNIENYIGKSKRIERNIYSDYLNRMYLAALFWSVIFPISISFILMVVLCSCAENFGIFIEQNSHFDSLKLIIYLNLTQAIGITTAYLYKTYGVLKNLRK